MEEAKRRTVDLEMVIFATNQALVQVPVRNVAAGSSRM